MKLHPSRRLAHGLLLLYEDRDILVVDKPAGLLVFAKSEEVKRKLMGSWDEAVTLRRYTALAEGVMAENEGIIDAPLGEDRGGRMVVREDGVR
ncbi:hypothetical protein AGMMS50293_22250 [Spirochaetia bacterium]|nr:hypothetical protein AGMMS50293_22250 [Spirochaetia bacterium]